MRTSCRSRERSVEESFDSGSGQLGNGFVHRFGSAVRTRSLMGARFRAWRIESASSRENYAVSAWLSPSGQRRVTDRSGRGVGGRGNRPAGHSLSASSQRIPECDCLISSPSMLFVSATKGIETTTAGADVRGGAKRVPVPCPNRDTFGADIRPGNREGRAGGGGDRIAGSRSGFDHSVRFLRTDSAAVHKLRPDGRGDWGARSRT